MTIAAFCLAGLMGSLFTFTTLRSPLARHVIDKPNRGHTLHRDVVPRIGGIVWGLSVGFCVVWFPLTSLNPLMLVALALAVLSFFDDHRSLLPALRLAVHLAAAILATQIGLESSSFKPLDFLGSLSPVAPSPIAILFAILAITWSTNLFNFMDGSDGMAGGMAVIGFGAYAIAASQVPVANTTATEFAHVSAIISGAALGFLFFNFPPARVFMGDAGSIPLGFLAATLGIQGCFSNLWPWWFPLLVFSPFIVDATVTLLKRIAKREKIWLGHRQHAYQRLILSGWSHRRTALTYYALMLACASSALLARLYAATPLFLWAWVIIYLLLLATVEIYLARKNKKKSEPL
jgi:UDP-GlcNAc:undecaprenyl-phosphate/decaprenyl-phosphate GlcNAc-1-phosphate transferase